MNKYSNGFTLVELAISIMVIGLLIGGVLKGQELIENARVAATVKQINDYRTAIAIFGSIYDALPGDMQNPGVLPNCTSVPCNQFGNGNGMVEPSMGPNWHINDTHSVLIAEYNYSVRERKNFWRHLSKAGVISDSISDAIPPTSNSWTNFLPVSPFNNTYFFAMHAHPDPNNGIGFDDNAFFLMSGNYSQPQITGRIAHNLDSKIDDGKPNTGKIVTMQRGPSIQAGCITTDGAEVEYNTNTKIAGGCVLIISIP